MHVIEKECMDFCQNLIDQNKILFQKLSKDAEFIKQSEKLKENSSLCELYIIAKSNLDCLDKISKEYVRTQVKKTILASALAVVGYQNLSTSEVQRDR